MHADRLLKLAELLEADAANPTGLKFDLGLWGSSRPDDWDGYTDESPPPLGISCGTTACAIGLAVLSGAFADAGLFNASASKCAISPGMRDSGAVGFNAAAELFGISPANASHLFCEGYYFDDEGERIVPTTGTEGELAVAARIREFVADHSPEDTTLNTQPQE